MKVAGSLLFCWWFFCTCDEQPVKVAPDIPRHYRMSIEQQDNIKNQALLRAIIVSKLRAEHKEREQEKRSHYDI